VPVEQHPAEIGERVAERRHLPVEHGVEPRRRVRREHHVVVFVVAVDQGVRVVGGGVVGEPLPDTVQGGHLSFLPRHLEGPLQLFVPAVDLAFGVALGVAKLLQAHRLHVDLVDLREGVDEFLADLLSVPGGLEAVGDARPRHVAGDPLHHVEV